MNERQGKAVGLAKGAKVYLCYSTTTLRWFAGIKYHIYPEERLLGVVFARFYKRFYFRGKVSHPKGYLFRGLI